VRSVVNRPNERSDIDFSLLGSAPFTHAPSSADNLVAVMRALCVQHGIDTARIVTLTVDGASNVRKVGRDMGVLGVLAAVTGTMA
jgi:hypothetical protein